jgi:hypothetical protein
MIFDNVSIFRPVYVISQTGLGHTDRFIIVFPEQTMFMACFSPQTGLNGVVDRSVFSDRCRYVHENARCPTDRCTFCLRDI